VLGAAQSTESAEDAGGTGVAEAAVLLHLSAGRHRAAALGVPSDLMVAAPSCARPDGGTSPAAYEPFGDTFRDGGAACSIRVFERLSGIRVDHHLVVDVAGFHKIATAVGGRTLDHEGELPRTLVRAARGVRGGGGTLTHPARLYGLLDTATSSITADPGLASLPALYELAGSLRALPAGGLVPVPMGQALGQKVGQKGDGQGAEQPQAEQLFAAVRADRPLPTAFPQ